MKKVLEVFKLHDFVSGRVKLVLKLPPVINDFYERKELYGGGEKERKGM